MIVVAITGILAAVALPAYQDYTNRAKVSEVVLAASSARTCVTEIVQSAGATALDSCGSSTAATRYVQKVEVDPASGVVTVTGQNFTEAVSVTLTPTIAGNAISQWICKGSPTKWMPGSCRGN